MTVLGMPLSMFLVFVATILAGSLGAIHYVVFHIFLGRPFADQEHHLEVRTAGGRASDAKRAAALGAPGGGVAPGGGTADDGRRAGGGRTPDDGRPTDGGHSGPDGGSSHG